MHHTVRRALFETQHLRKLPQDTWYQAIDDIKRDDRIGTTAQQSRGEHLHSASSAVQHPSTDNSCVYKVQAMVPAASFLLSIDVHCVYMMMSIVSDSI